MSNACNVSNTTNRNTEFSIQFRNLDWLNLIRIGTVDQVRNELSYALLVGPKPYCLHSHQEKSSAHHC